MLPPPNRGRDVPQTEAEGASYVFVLNRYAIAHKWFCQKTNRLPRPITPHKRASRTRLVGTSLRFGIAACMPVGSRTGAVFRRSSLAVAPRFLATQRDHKLRQHNLSVVSARDELRQTIAILGWQEHRWQKERLCNFGHLHHGGLQSGRVTCAMGILHQLTRNRLNIAAPDVLPWAILAICTNVTDKPSAPGVKCDGVSGAD